ncbi:MAG: ISKra4 family transposase [Acidobacteria bacterium]|nr:ISKra4 family transposase [Acidobacteriota bacterium]
MTDAVTSAAKKKKLWWHTRFGEIKVEEQTYRRGREGPLVRPLCASAGVVCRGYSLWLQRVLTDFGADESFADGAAKVKEHYGIEVPISAVASITQQQAARMRQEPEGESPWPEPGVEQVIAEADGCLVPVVKIKESEEIGDKRRGRTVDWQEARLSLARKDGAVSKHYQATMKSVEEAGAQLRECVIAVGGGAQTKIHCVGDGAPWIVKQVEEKFGESATYLVDFYHVSEYLSAAADSIAGVAGKPAWLHQQQEHLKQNRVSEVLIQLRAHQEPQQINDDHAPVRACERYLSHRLPYLDDQSALAADLPIGSGEVESGHRGVIQARLKLSGAWWKPDHADAMLALRTVRANGQWQAYWDDRRQAAA